jgi:hypothetical protein
LQHHQNRRVPTLVGVGQKLSNEFFTGDLLIHQTETCPFGPPPPSALESGGISLWDVTDPTSPEPVTLHTGDFEGRPQRWPQPDALDVRLAQRVRRPVVRGKRGPFWHLRSNQGWIPQRLISRQPGKTLSCVCGFKAIDQESVTRLDALRRLDPRGLATG